MSLARQPLRSISVSLSLWACRYVLGMSMVAMSRCLCASMAAVIMMLFVATVGEAPSSFLYPGRVRSLLPSATARTLTLPSRFLTMFMSE